MAGELGRVKRDFGNQAIFGGSYGWASAGRFHHAQSQVRRFLNSIGGFVRHKDDYSVGAALVLMPHIVAPLEELLASHTSWELLAKHCKLFVSFGGVPRKNAPDQRRRRHRAQRQERPIQHARRWRALRQCHADGR